MEDESLISYMELGRKLAFKGKTPEAFLVNQVMEAKAEHNRLMGSGEITKPFTKHDAAIVAVIWMQGGILREEDVAKAVSELGLTPEEAEEFVSKTLPEAKEILEEDDKKDRELADQNRTDLLNQYTQEWGLPRLDGIVDYFQSQLPQIEAVNPRWQQALETFPNRRHEVEEMLSKIDSPRARVGILMRELYGLTNIHPSEAMKIFEAEQQGSYVYADSLFRLAVSLYENDTGKDPDFENVEAGALTVSLKLADNPEHLAWMNREAAMEELTFGAEHPGEVYSPGKPLLTPFKQYPIIMPPESTSDGT